MQNFRIITAATAVMLAAIAPTKLRAQSGAGNQGWEVLMRAPIPGDAVPMISVSSIPLAPAPPTPRTGNMGHTHAGPVFAYIVQGEIENQVEPDAPQVYTLGGFFYEAPGHVHRFMRNLSTAEPAKVIVFQAGDRGRAAPAIQLLIQAPLPTTANRELGLLRLRLAPGAQAAVHAHSGPGIVYVVAGRIEIAGAEQTKTYDEGDVLLEPVPSQAEVTVTNRGATTATVLLYQVDNAPGRWRASRSLARTLLESFYGLTHALGGRRCRDMESRPDLMISIALPSPAETLLL